MFTLEQKLREATLHAAALKRRASNRKETHRNYPRHLQRIAIAEEIARDYRTALEMRVPMVTTELDRQLDLL